MVAMLWFIFWILILCYIVAPIVVVIFAAIFHAMYNTESKIMARLDREMEILTQMRKEGVLELRD